MSATPLSGLADWPRLGWSSFRRLFRAATSHPRPLSISLILFAGDLFFILYLFVAELREHFYDDTRLLDRKALLITTDGGLPEWFSYAQALVLVILFARMLRSTKEPIYAALTVTFLVVLLDDAMEIHETGGKYFAHLLRLRTWSGLRARDLGELLTWGLLGLLVVPLLVFGLVRSTPKHRGNGLAFLAVFAALAFCAIFVDLLYFAGHFREAFWPRLLFIEGEDGGEMLVITLACMLALGAEQERRG